MNLSKEKFQEEFHNYELPSTLSSLIDFENSITDRSYYSEGFELATRDEFDSGMRNFSVYRSFFKSMVPFAQANHSGSFYAFWNPEQQSDLSNAPIVVFGDEGGVLIVGNNINELMQILTLDTEAFISDSKVYYMLDEEDYDDDDDEEDLSSEHIERFKNWVTSELNLTLPSEKEVESMVDSAQNNHQERLNGWMSQYAN